MSSQVEICNVSLTFLGKARINALSDNKDSARALTAVWDMCRRAELAKRFWGFSLARAQLAALVGAPSWGYANQYQLPTGFIRLVQAGQYYAANALIDYRSSDDSPYAIEGQAILTDQGSPLKIRYVQDITDPSLFNPLFADALAARLASRVCEELTGSNTKMQTCEEWYKDAVFQAAKANAIERPPQGIPDDSWGLARL